MKNKILKFLILPILVVSLIIPLCSFTTTDSEYYDITPYKPLFTCDVGYAYHRVTTTIDKYYYGYINEFNNTIMSYGNVNSIKREASDYIVVGNTSINYAGTTSSYPVPSSYSGSSDTVNASVSLYSEDKSVAFFDGRFTFKGLSKVAYAGTSNPLNYTSILLADDIDDGIHTYSITELNCSVYVGLHRLNIGQDGSVSIEYQTLLYDIIGENLSSYDIMRIEGDQGNFIYNTKGFSLGGIVDSVLVIAGDWYIDEVTLDFAFPIEYDDSDLVGTLGFKYCCVTDKLYSQTSDNTIYDDEITSAYKKGFNDGSDVSYNEGYDVGYSEGSEVGYSNGYSDGVDHAPIEWGSVGQFLVHVLGAFTSAELFPGFSIGGLLGVIAGGLLLLMFLKMFAGG